MFALRYFNDLESVKIKLELNDQMNDTHLEQVLSLLNRVLHFVFECGMIDRLVVKCVIEASSISISFSISKAVESRMNVPQDSLLFICQILLHISHE